MNGCAKSKFQILVVDDEPIILDLVEGLLTPAYDVRLASSGAEALEKSLELPLPDLILMDYLMPGLDGVDTCQQLQKNILTKDIPVLFLTIKSDIDDELRGFAAGAVDYILKPVSAPQLIARVRTHLELKATQQALAKERDKLQRLLRQRSKELEKAQALAFGFIESLVVGDKNSDRSILYKQALEEYLGVNMQQIDVSKLLNSRKALAGKSPIPELSKDVIVEQLEKVLASQWFISTERLRELLKFIVLETLDGHTSTLKAFTIAVEVFQRDESFDPQRDPLIRVHAGNLRKRLTQYYQSNGIHDAVVISVPKGSYHAEFSRNSSLIQYMAPH